MPYSARRRSTLASHRGTGFRKAPAFNNNHVHTADKGRAARWSAVCWWRTSSPVQLSLTRNSSVSMQTAEHQHWQSSRQLSTLAVTPVDRLTTGPHTNLPLCHRADCHRGTESVKTRANRPPFPGDFSPC